MDWADIQDMYDAGGEPAARAYQPDMNILKGADKALDYLQIEVPGVPRWMKTRGLLRHFMRTANFRTCMHALLEQRQGQLQKPWQTINGSHSVCDLSIAVNLKPPRMRTMRHREATKQVMIAGFLRPSAQVELDRVVRVICSALCEGPKPLVTCKTCINKITAVACYAEQDSVEIRINRHTQKYDMKQI